MIFRKVNPSKVVRRAIMVSQAGTPIPSPDLERAHLQRVDIEKAAMAFIDTQKRGKRIRPRIWWMPNFTSDWRRSSGDSSTTDGSSETSQQWPRRRYMAIGSPPTRPRGSEAADLAELSAADISA